MRKRQIITLSCLIALLSCAVPCALAASHEHLFDPADQAKDRVVKIGFLTSLSGVGASGGAEMVEGIKLYLHQNHNRIGGQKAELIVTDDESDPSVAAAKVKKLVSNDHIDILDGVFLSNVGYAITPFIEKYQLPSVFAVCGSDDLTKRRHLNWLVRCGSSGSQSMHPLGAWAHSQLHYKKIVTIGTDYAYGYEAVGGFQTTFEKSGGQVVQKIWVPLGVTDFGPWLKHIDAGADAIFVVAVNRAAVALVKQIRAAGIRLPLIGSGATFDEHVLPQVGDECLNGISAHVYSAALSRKENQRFVEAFRTMYGHDPSYYAESAYTSAMYMSKALNMVKGDVSDKQKLMSALKTVKIDNAPRGPLSEDAFANPIENVYIRKVDRVNGKLTNKVIDTFPAVSQFWNYDPAEFLARPAYSRDYPPCLNCVRQNQRAN